MIMPGFADLNQFVRGCLATAGTPLPARYRQARACPSFVNTGWSGYAWRPCVLGRTPGPRACDRARADRGLADGGRAACAPARVLRCVGRLDLLSRSSSSTWSAWSACGLASRSAVQMTCRSIRHLSDISVLAAHRGCGSGARGSSASKRSWRARRSGPAGGIRSGNAAARGLHAAAAFAEDRVCRSTSRWRRLRGSAIAREDPSSQPVCCG